MKNGKKLAVPVADRLARYYQLAMEKREDGVTYISSATIAGELGVTSATVRKDLSYLSASCGAKRGYDTECLERLLRRALVADQTVNVAIVGAGNMGRALALHRRFADCGFRVRAVFDRAPSLIGCRIGDVKVTSAARMAAVVRRKGIAIAIVAVPEAVAQATTDQLVRAGVKGILNLSEGHIRAPKDVHVLDVRIVAGLLGLSCRMRMADRQSASARK
jgi:redox-sensing transcriptional repressor